MIALDPARNIVVQASAGTGKTWLLTSRLLRLLLGGAAPGSVLAITFTRQAAAEMQQRVTHRCLNLALCSATELEAALRELGAPRTDSMRERARGLYEALLSDPYSFRIMTFHAFSQELLQRFPLEAGVPPGFDLCEQTGELERAAWDAFEQELTRQPDDPYAKALDRLLRDIGTLQATRSGLLTFLRHRSDWWAYTEGQPDPPTYAADQLAHRLDIPISGPVPTFLLADPQVRADLVRYAQLLERHPTPTNAATVQRIADALSSAEHGAALALLGTAFLTREGQPRLLRTGATLTKRLGAADAGQLERLHSALAQRVQAAIARERRRGTLELSRAWYLCGARLLDHFQRLKREQNLLDFADLEWLAYRLLSAEDHAEWVQYKLDRRIDHLLVDEFQDTNPTQWRLLQPLLQELAAGNPERARSAFLVGDAKQSIYRFRRAEPRLFDTARDWLVQTANADIVSQDVSWRSSPAILDFVDWLFDATAGEPAYALENYRAHSARHAELWGRVELLPLIRREQTEHVAPTFRDPLTAPRIVAEDERHYREGQLVAAKMVELVGRPIGHDGRPLRYGDIMVLLRDRTHAPDYERALRRAGIPYAGADRGNFVHCLEVRDLIQLLTLLLVPDDNLALATVLRSPLFDATHEDLQLLAQGAAETAWYDRLLALSPLSTAGALARAQRLLPRWRAGVDRVPVHDLLDRIYCEGDVLARYAAAAPAHLQDRVAAQLNRLLSLALDVDGGRFPSLARFIDRLPALAADDYEMAPGADTGDRVRLMTIHAAKGLEAPVVFLVNAAQASNNRDRGPRALIEWPAGAARPDTFQFIGRKEDMDDVSAAIRDRVDAGSRREESNLLYVALTRAQQVLYISGCESGRANGDRFQRGWYGFIESRLAAARDRRPFGTALTLEEIKDDAGTTINIVGRLEHGTPLPSPVPRAATPEPDVTIDPALTRPLAAAIPHPAYIPPSRQNDPEAEPAGVEAAAMRSTAARRGAIIHRALERASAGSSLPASAVRAELWREWSGQVSEDEFEAYWVEARAVLEHSAFRPFFDAAAYQQARNETPILYARADQTVYGIIDRLVWHNDEILLLDYKTHRITRAEVASVASRYRPQLALYAEGVRRLWPGKRVRPFVIFTACREAVELD